MVKKILTFLVATVLCAGMSGCFLAGTDEAQSIGIIGGADGPTSIVVSKADKGKDVKDKNEELIKNAILKHNEGGYMSGECIAEGHITLGIEKGENQTFVAYVLTMYGEYGFENGNFVKVSGSGVIPVRITFDKGGNVIEYKYPMDGNMYVQSIKEMYPEKYQKRALSIQDKDHEALKQMEKVYAMAYLDEIGREAQIGDYGDFEHTLLTDVGVSVEASNEIVTSKVSEHYPIFIGNREEVVDGTRYVYEMKWEEKSEGVGTVSFIKYLYDTKEILDRTDAVIDGDNVNFVFACR